MITRALLVILLATPASAAIRAIPPETALIRPDKPLEREDRNPPCLRLAERPRTVWWMLVGPDGSEVIVGAAEIRQRC